MVFSSRFAQQVLKTIKSNKLDQYFLAFLKLFKCYIFSMKPQNPYKLFLNIRILIILNCEERASDILKFSNE